MSAWLISASAESRLGETTDASADRAHVATQIDGDAVSTLPVGIQTKRLTSTTPVALIPLAFCQRLSAFLVAAVKLPLIVFL